MTIERLEPDADLAPIIEIERASFSVPWTEDMFRWELRNNDVAAIWVLREGQVGKLGQVGPGGILAFCCVWVVMDELHINNVAVRPNARNGGLATRLLEHVMADAAARGAERVTLEVRRSNVIALNLYQKLGFRTAGVRPGYYTDPVEDALILWHDMSGPSSSAGPPAP